MKLNFNMARIFKVLSPAKSLTTRQDYVNTARAIEDFLVHTYKPEHYAQRKWNLYEERRSLLTESLYKQILREKQLPTVEAFVSHYLEKNAHLIDQQAERFFANLAYLSLVTDLHFYFVLKGSGLFDRVEMDYEYDLTAFTDILLTINGQTIGLQLFAGREQSQIGKELQLALDTAVRSYPIYLFSRKSPNGTRKQLITVEGNTVELYSEQDAAYWANFLKEKNGQTIEQFEELILNENCEIYTLAQPLEQTQPYKRNWQFEGNWDAYLQEACHSMLIIGSDIVSSLPNHFAQAAQAKGISLQLFDIPLEKVPKSFRANRIIIDGLIDNKPLSATMYKELHPYFDKVQCNIFQYEVEHYDATSDIIVAAGAGSGKTHTLVSRALFLINTGKVKSLKEIAMITFTNETADRMREKLAERFLQLLQQTGDLKYLTYLEDLQEMQISTIPAFAKRILTQFGQFIGLGTELKISNLTMQRREIIEKQLDIEVQNGFPLKQFGKLPYFALIQFIENIWEKIEQKGLSPKDFSNAEEQLLFRLLLSVLTSADETFRLKKQKENTVTLADLTRYLQDLIQVAPLERLKEQISYLFVDEFQDTDNAQIEFISVVAQKSAIPVLVVGDIKQSIYRFRGANATAFKELELQLEQSNRHVHTVELRYNYRTTNTLLQQLEAMFAKWRKGDWLPKDDLAMIAKRTDAVFKDRNAFDLKYEKFNENHILQYYRDSQKITKQNETPPTLAILVRRNSEVLAVGEMLEKLKQSTKIMCDVQLEGTLFQSLAAKDLLLLLESWISPTDKGTLYAFQETAFCRGTQKQAVVARTPEQFIVTQQPLGQLPNAWYEALEHLKFHPGLLVLNKFLSKVPYIENLKQEGKELDETMKYQLNLYKILMLLYAALEEQTDLLTLYEWLALQVATNKEEDEAELDATQFEMPLVKVMTVHKSKGLEFHTVLVPYTQNSFIRNAPNHANGRVNFKDKPFENKNGKTKIQTYSDILVQTLTVNNKSIHEIGWLYADRDSQFSSITNRYDDLKSKEDTEAAKEETRVLYVALTRAEDRCIVFGLQSNNHQSIHIPPTSWANLLLMEDK